MIIDSGVRGEVMWGKCQTLRQLQLKMGESLAKFKNTHRFTMVFKYIVISKLFISCPLIMAENPPTSIDIDPERQDG